MKRCLPGHGSIMKKGCPSGRRSVSARPSMPLWPPLPPLMKPCQPGMLPAAQDSLRPDITGGFAKRLRQPDIKFLLIQSFSLHTIFPPCRIRAFQECRRGRKTLYSTVSSSRAGLIISQAEMKKKKAHPPLVVPLSFFSACVIPRPPVTLSTLKKR